MYAEKSVGSVKKRRMLSVMTAWEMIQNSMDVARNTAAQMPEAWSFRMREAYQPMRVTASAPKRAAGRRAAKLEKPNTV